MTTELRVAIVTGAGRGIGREHALHLASHGCAVVVNDLGGGNDGQGADSGPAHAVAKEIVDLGGEAVANTDNVSDWGSAERLVKQAVGEFGRLDVLVNNAGILRDSFVATMDEAQWDSVIAVHLKGHFGMLHHAAAYWKTQAKAGEPVNAAVINTSSPSGTFANNPGQANYAAAKAGIAAMTDVAAQELARYGVRVNAIAPIARTRLTLATPGFGEMVAETSGSDFDVYSAANIAPLVGYLASADCRVTGRVFSVQGGKIELLEGWTPTKTLEADGPWTEDAIAAWASSN